MVTMTRATVDFLIMMVKICLNTNLTDQVDQFEHTNTFKINV